MKISINLEVRGTESILKRVENLKDGKLLDAGLKRGAIYLKSEVAKYPPKPPQSTYNRKGAAGGLASGWQVDSDVKDNTAILRNNIPYAQWVQGEKQVWFHKRTGWINVPQLIKDHEERVAQLVIDTMRRKSYK